MDCPICPYIMVVVTTICLRRIWISRYIYTVIADVIKLVINTEYHGLTLALLETFENQQVKLPYIVNH